jgi:hypothetical protein
MTLTPQDKSILKFYIVASLIVNIIVLLIFCGIAKAEDWSDSEIADAIYLAEGGKKAKVPFGILSVKCNGYAECRQVCLNTIRNNRKRYAAYGYKQYKTFLEFLWHRYCPPEIYPKNKFWLRNVRFWLKKRV